jgi:bla regulator protein BlaR1
MISKYFTEVTAVVAPAMANHLWQSTLFMVLAAIVALALRKNQARIRHGVWMAASLKFLIPFSLLISLGSRLASPHFSLNAGSGLYSVMKEFGQPFTFIIVAPASHEWNAAYLLTLLPGVIAAVWLCGLVTVLILWATRWRRVVAAVQHSTAMDQGREVAALRQLEKMEGVREPMALLLSQDSALEPGVFGIFRPVLLWPAKISEHLQDSHLRAILAHEVAHVRRRDNLAAALHMVVEAIFWFHPLVWWLGTRLVEERELACDEQVLQLGNPPSIYAESILKTCKFCVESPLACISGVTGAELKKRILRIMTPAMAEKLSPGRKLLLASVAIATLSGPVLFGLWQTPPVSAQSQVGSASSPTGVAPPRIYHVGADVSAPKLIFAPDPEFSEEAKRAKYQGVCVVSLIVDAQGNPQHIQVVRHLGKGLDQKAVEAVNQYRFKPAMLHKKPVPVQVNIEVNFRLY